MLSWTLEPRACGSIALSQGLWALELRRAKLLPAPSSPDSSSQEMRTPEQDHRAVKRGTRPMVGFNWLQVLKISLNY